LKNTRLKKMADWTNYDAGDNKIIKLLNEAIQYQTKIKIEYGGTWRTISPFAWGTSKEGDTVVKCYSVPSAGKSMDSGENGLDVKSFRADKITNASPMPNESTDKGKYNNDLDVSNEYDDLQDKEDKNYGKDKYIANVDSKLEKESALHQADEFHLPEDEVRENLNQYCISELEQEAEKFGIDDFGKMTMKELIEELVDVYYLTDLSGTKTSSLNKSASDNEKIAHEIEDMEANVDEEDSYKFEQVLTGYLDEIDPGKGMSIYEVCMELSEKELSNLYNELLNFSYNDTTEANIKIASNEDESGPDNVKLTKEVDGYPIGTVCTIMDNEDNKYILQVNEDGHEIKTTKANFKRLDGKKFEAWGSISSKLKKEASTKENIHFKEIAQKIENMESTAKDNDKFQEILCDYLYEVDPHNNMNIPEACMMLNTHKLEQLYEELCGLEYNDKIEKEATREEDDSDDIDFDEAMAETVDCLNEMKRRVNEWNVRNTLLMFTSWSFYKGDVLSSVDEATAKKIIVQVLNYVDSIHENDIEKLLEVYDIVSHYFKY